MSGGLFVLGNIVLQLLVLRLHLVGNVFTLGLLDLKLEHGGGELEDLVLDLAALQTVRSCFKNWRCWY